MMLSSANENHEEPKAIKAAEEIKKMAEDSQFILKRNFIDEKRWFNVALFSPA